jgi:hypothetical protein
MERSSMPRKMIGFFMVGLEEKLIKVRNWSINRGRNRYKSAVWI